MAGTVELGALPPGVARAALNVVVVTLDTTRADRIGAYGQAAAVETPVFDRLAREGTLFEQAMASAPLTLPSHATMFTAQFPPAHGVRDNGGFFLAPDADHARRTPPGCRRANRRVRRRLRARLQVGAGSGIRALRGRLRSLKSPRDVRRKRSAPRRTRSSTSHCRGSKRSRTSGSLRGCTSTIRTRRTPRRNRSRRDTPVGPTTEKSRLRMRNLGESSTSSQTRGLLDRTIIAVLADHGEGLGDHGEGTHGFFIYESATRTPFVIRAPFERTSARRVSDPVRTVGSDADAARSAGTSGPAGAGGRDEPRAADDRRPCRIESGRVCGGDVPAPSLRVECAARAASGPVQTD